MQIPQYVVYLFPAAAIVFAGCWLAGYAKIQRSLPDKLAWVVEGPKSPLDSGTRGRMSLKDILFALLITAVYSAAAFFYLGNTQAPQSFWKAESDANEIVIDLGAPVVIDTVFYYTGNYHAERNPGAYQLEFSADGVDFRAQPNMQQEHSMTFQWQYGTLSPPLEPTRYIRIKAITSPLELGELCIIATDEGERYIVTSRMKVTALPESAAALFDEQYLIPAQRETLNGAYFDEIYHARAAYELNGGTYNYEITHPPLGKEIIALGVKLFGMTPFGWRFMGTLFGVLMLPLFYLLLKQIFNSTIAAACGTIVWAADFMHFTQTRIATIDTYNVFFVLLMFIFMHRWMTLPKTATFLRTLPPLFMCGLMFGLGAAAKWSSIYAGAGLLALYIIKLAADKRGTAFVLKTLAASAVFFLLIPAAVYTVSYIPYVTARGIELNFTNLFDEMWRNQVYMFQYHSGLTDSHTYAARWYDWILNARPICYFYQMNSGASSVSTIMALNNPLLAWGGFVALVLCVIEFVEHRCMKAMFIVCGYLSVFLPWVIVPRLTFAYHYFPASMFLAAAVAHAFWRITQSDIKGRNSYIAAFTIVSCLLFVMFYPALSGLPVPYWYTKYVLQWMPTWPL